MFIVLLMFFPERERKRSSGGGGIALSRGIEQNMWRGKCVCGVAVCGDALSGRKMGGGGPFCNRKSVYTQVKTSGNEKSATWSPASKQNQNYMCAQKEKSKINSAHVVAALRIYKNMGFIFSIKTKRINGKPYIEKMVEIMGIWYTAKTRQMLILFGFSNVFLALNKKNIFFS